MTSVAVDADEADDIRLAFAQDFMNRTELAEILAADANEVVSLESESQALCVVFRNSYHLEEDSIKLEKVRSQVSFVRFVGRLNSAERCAGVRQSIR